MMDMSPKQLGGWEVLRHGTKQNLLPVYIISSAKLTGNVLPSFIELLKPKVFQAEALFTGPDLFLRGQTRGETVYLGSW